MGRVRQEGFARLARGLAEVSPSDDPVRDLAALGAAYAANAVENRPSTARCSTPPPTCPIPRPPGRGSRCRRRGQRAVDAGRFVDADPAAVATRFWASGHGVLLLVLSGVLPDDALDEHSPALATAVFTAAGDDPERCAASVRAGWAGPRAGDVVDSSGCLVADDASETEASSSSVPTSAAAA